MKILLVYEEIPENTWFYEFEIDQHNPLLVLLESVNGHTVNYDEPIPTAIQMCDALSTKMEYCSDVEHPFKCVITDIAQKNDVPSNSAFDRVFSFGIMM
jgi:hypothetical protein